MDSGVAYGLWPLVVVNTVLFAVFAAVFFHPHTGRDGPVVGACTPSTEGDDSTRNRACGAPPRRRRRHPAPRPLDPVAADHDGHATQAVLSGTGTGKEPPR